MNHRSVRSALVCLAVLAVPGYASAQTDAGVEAAPETAPETTTESVATPDEPAPTEATTTTPAIEEHVEESAPAIPEPPAASSPLPAATTSSGDMEAGFTAADGAYIRTHDRAWSLRVGILAQLRVTGSSTPDPTRQFEFVPVLTRLYLQGTVVEPWVRYYLQTEFAGQESPSSALPNAPSPRILDAFVEAQPHEAFGVRVGMMRPFFTRSWIAGLGSQLMFDRTDANAYFRNHGPAGGGTLGTVNVVPDGMGGTLPSTLGALPVAWDRDIGATIFGRPAGGMFEYYAGVFNGNGYLFGRNEALSAMPMLRLVVNPLGAMSYSETPALANPHQPPRLMIGVAGYYNSYRTVYNQLTTPPIASQVLSEEQFTFGSDVTFQAESVYVTGEFYYRNRRTADGNRHDEIGGYGMAGWMFWAPLLEVAARFSMIDPNLGIAGNFRQTYDVELNCYPAGNNIRFGLRYSLAINDATQNINVVGSAGAGPVPPPVVMIPGGTAVHSVGLWGQLNF